MFNVSIAFKILENHENLLAGYTKSSGHLVFDVKMDFTRKARWVKVGHKHQHPDPESSSYAGVVSRESVRIALTYHPATSSLSQAEDSTLDEWIVRREMLHALFWLRCQFL
jgi:hypothetical protein